MKLFSSGLAAKELDVCRETVNIYVKKNQLIPFAVVNGRYLFSEQEIKRFQDEKKLAPKLQKVA